MIDAIVASFVDSVSEREFDAAFMALLRARGYYDIHFTHGSYEFGKDFIAKIVDQGTECQYVFQSKAGNFNLEKWASAAPQIELLRHSQLSHPNFDPVLPRKAVLVMTGRLSGGAITAAQDFCRQAASSDVPLTTWDRETLIEYMVPAISAGLADRVEAPLLSMVAAGTNHMATEAQIEQFSGRWCMPGELPAACALESAIVATALNKSGRSDLASFAGLALVRAASWHTHGGTPTDTDWVDAASLGRRLFATYADSLFERLNSGDGLSPASLIRAHREPGALVTHSVRCSRIVELIGLLGLLGVEERTDRSSVDIARWLSTFIRSQAATATPISDRWAVSIIPATLLLLKHGLVEEASDYLRAVFVWIVRRHRDGCGLADATATAEVEIRQVIGLAVPQSTAIQRRDESYLAAVFLDLSAFVGLVQLYRFARDDFRRFRVLPSVIATADTQGQYLLDGAGVAKEINVPYADVPSLGWTSAAPHLPTAAAPRYLETSNRPWDHLAVSAVLRDRHFVCGWPALLE